jgi:hypothetical protein
MMEYLAALPLFLLIAGLTAGLILWVFRESWIDEGWW